MILVIALAFVAGTLTMATLVTAQVDPINACVDSKGKLRTVDSPGDCKSKETLLQWNIQGLQGDTGPQGEQGPAGPAGATVCPSGSVQHWDKILFEFNFANLGGAKEETQIGDILAAYTAQFPATVEIKLEDLPNELVSLNRRVATELNNNPLWIAFNPDFSERDFTFKDIIILDAKYETICVAQP